MHACSAVLPLVSAFCTAGIKEERRFQQGEERKQEVGGGGGEAVRLSSSCVLVIWSCGIDVFRGFRAGVQAWQGG